MRSDLFFTSASTLVIEKNVPQDPQVLTSSEVLGENFGRELFFDYGAQTLHVHFP